MGPWTDQSCWSGPKRVKEEEKDEEGSEVDDEWEEENRGNLKLANRIGLANIHAL